MPQKILLVSATLNEGDILNKIKGVKAVQDGFIYKGHEILPLITGVGSVATAWSLTRWISSGFKPDLAINIGIAGSFTDDLPVGDVVMPFSDCFADAGIDTGKEFLTLAEAGLEDPDRFPFRGGRIYAGSRIAGTIAGKLKKVNAITVNTASGSPDTINRLVAKYHPDIETMEGATFFYICSREKIPFAAMRSISNKVGPRNREKWNIPLALRNLQKELESILSMID